MTSMSSEQMSATTQNAAPSQALKPSLEPSPSRRQHSRSMPATPSHGPQPNSHQRRSPSAGQSLNNGSPRSESSQTAPAPRKPQLGCKYETGMAKARRRVPYSLGPEKLGPEPLKRKRTLSTDQEEKLSRDIQDLYERLLPTPESEARRTKFVEKLERILRERWPSSSIKVNVFGSTGNNLGTSDSDVDVCITTNSAELSRVCSIAELLATNGMERVVCVSSAKVPIVKLWDPDLQVACDLNVNNPIALENTAMIKNYVAIDARVRPLAMIIKHWAKRRILNDAALGNTLSSYTWICLALNFLQTRQPPVLPSLQDQPHLQPRMLNGVNISFDKDIDAYRDFGASNTESVGQLLFQFFRYYGFDLDFEHSVLSVRKGAILSKKEKSWHLLQDNRLCVEEPFNISRNLANTADDTSVRGIHMELRRAFGLIADGQLDQCCEQYRYPPEEPKASADFVPPSSRPVIPQPPPITIRGGKQNSRGGRGAHLSRNTTSNTRRSSNPMTRGAPNPGVLRSLPFQMTSQELQLQAQHQQHLLHDQLFQQYQYLQLQEQELRLRLNQQRQRGFLASGGYQPSHLGLYAAQDENVDTSATSFANSARPPMSAPLYQQRFGASPFLHPSLPVNGISTNPSSPYLSPVLPDARRFSRRTSLTQSATGASMRAQSQPARTLPARMTASSGLPGPDFNDYLAGRRLSSASNANDASASYLNRLGMAGQAYYEPARRPPEYVGYYVGQSPSLLGYPHSASISPIPSHVGLAIHNGGLSPRSAAASPQPSLSGATLVPPSSEALSDQASLHEVETNCERPTSLNGKCHTSPKIPTSAAIVNGSHTSPPRRHVVASSRTDVEDALTFSASTSEDFPFDTPSSSDDNSPDLKENGIRQGSSPTNSIERRTPPPARDLAHMPNGHVTETPMTLEQNQKPSVLPYPLGRQLSAVQEVRTPSPETERGHRISTSISSIKSQSKLAQGQGQGTESPPTSPAIGSLNPKSYTNNTSAAESTTPSSWQMPKKKKSKRKTVKSENDAQGVNASGGELRPLDESQRKGG